MEIKIVDFEKKYDHDVLKIFYQTVFYQRKEFEYTRLPTWHHRYSLENKSIIRLAKKDNEIVGSLGLLAFEGFIKEKKYGIGFFVDNCVPPKFHNNYNGIMGKLFDSIEEQAKSENIDIIMGWDYTRKADQHHDFFKQKKYNRIDGVNWFGGGTKPVEYFPGNHHIAAHWKFALSIFNQKFRRREAKIPSLNNIRIRPMKEKDVNDVVNILNKQNEGRAFAPKYTVSSLKNTMKKYHSKAIVADDNGTIIGVLIVFTAPWSGWMFGKPEYTRTHSFSLIYHPLEFAVVREYQEKVPAHMLFSFMNDKERQRKYLMFVDVFDRRVTWMKKAYNRIGADELPYDFGTVLIKNLTGKHVDLSKPIYIPTNLVISPYTTKNY